jgi:putative oxygen-independent coproporphyrinogen III oxidase
MHNTLGLYIHVPWCVKKCPYCDFNSHAQNGELPESDYITALIAELDEKQPMVHQRTLQSIFIGGGTPSLFTPHAYDTLFTALKQRFTLAPNLEITLEANPGTVDQTRFQGFYQAGINRLSLGVQSLDNAALNALGRIHTREHAINAITAAKKAGFLRINVDLMFALPHQSVDAACDDLKTAIALGPTHLSWYHLTIEPNTFFYHHPPKQPNPERIWAMQEKGQALLKQAGFLQYEISAYSKHHDPCQHNLNYWHYGDYLGIGAGAHSKLTDPSTGNITRHWNVKHPKDYLNPTKSVIANQKPVAPKARALEFMMNALRLIAPTPIRLFEAQTGLSLADIDVPLRSAQARGLLTVSSTHFIVTPKGRDFLNDLLEGFLP